MSSLTPKIQHTFGGAPHPLSEFAKFAHAGLEDKDYGFVTENGPEAARQLLRYLTDLPTKAGCPTTEQFVVGYISLTDTPDNATLKAWEKLLGDTFTLAKIDNLEQLPGGTREFAERFIPLLRDVAAIASPLLVAWGK